MRDVDGFELNAHLGEHEGEQVGVVQDHVFVVGVLSFGGRFGRRSGC
jgi:hypothetical protein